MVLRGKIVDGRVQKIFKERALLEQAFIKDTSKTVAEHIKAQVATIGENIQVTSRAHGAKYLSNLFCTGDMPRARVSLKGCERQAWVLLQLMHSATSCL